MRSKRRLTPSRLLLFFAALFMAAAFVFAPMEHATALPGAEFRVDSVGLSPALPSYIQSEEINIAVGITNDGSAAGEAGAVTVNVTFPAEVTVNSYDDSTIPALFTCTLGQTTSCVNTADITNGTSVTLFFTTTAASPTGAPVFISAEVQHGDDTNPADNLMPSPQFSIVPLPPGPDLEIAITHQGSPAGSPNFQPGSSDGTVTVTIRNVGGMLTTGATLVFIPLQGGLTRIESTTQSGSFSCTRLDSVQCTSNATFTPGQTETITFNVQAPASDPDPTLLYRNLAFLINGSDVIDANNQAQDPQFFDIAGPPTATPRPTFTLIPTLPLPPTATLIPSPTATFTPTLIPPPATRTPLPRPANAGLAIPIPPTGVHVVVNRDGVNIRLLPAIGAEVVGFVNAGTVFENVEARSPDNEWLRVNLGGLQAWVGVPVITVLSGDITTLPVADPRTIPYGGFENPRAGLTSQISQWIGRLAQSGLRLRAGPSRGYPVLANAPRYAELRLLGRTADNLWTQVNWEGTLGWVASEFLELPEPGLALYESLPVDGIVADALPISEPTHDSYMDTLRLMLDRLELAQPSLDEIRARWTTVALGEPTQCGNYPARPSDYNIPNTVLAPFYDTLNPLITDFNAAMQYLRQAIDFLIESCQFAQPPAGRVGEGGAAVALQAVNEADALFASLRARLNELIPDDRTPTEEECLFTFQNNSEIVPRLRPSTVQFGRLNSRNVVTGFCFDATIGANFRIEIVKVSGNILPMVSVSAFNSPTNFLGVGRIGSQGETYTSVAPILIPETGQYIVIVSDLAETEGRGAPEGEFAILLTDLTGTSGVLPPGMAFDPNTGQVIINPSPFNPVVPTAIFSTPDPNAPPVVPVAPSVCPNVTYTCAQLLTCGEAQACLAAGNISLDADADGIPCEENLCGGSFAPTITPRPTISVGS